MSLSLSHQYGEFVDRGVVYATLAPSDNSRIDCSTGVSVEQIGNRLTLSIRRVPGTRSEGDLCTYQVTTNLGPLAVGIYEITGRLLSIDGLSAETQIQIVRVLPLEGRCNATPELSPSLFVLPKNLAADQFVQRIATDAAYAASLGNPTTRGFLSIGGTALVGIDYPPLFDPTVGMDRLLASGEFKGVSRNGYACGLPPPDTTAQFVEFYHPGLDDFFYSGNAGEIAAIDAGQVGAPWARTGKGFRAVTQPGCIFSTTDTIVYRFWGIPGVGPDSHFFTRDRAECYIVDKSAQWSLEGVPFWATEPRSDGTCAQTRIPLYRVWRPFGDSNHRFTTDRAVVSEMVSKGWIDEGAAMCVLPPA